MSIVGHGVDLVHVPRLARLLADHPERFLERVFTAQEAAYAGGGPGRAERLAARFAAKEAAMKALGSGWTGGVAWTDIEVRRGLSGEPTLAVSGGFARLAAARSVDRWLVSLSHAGEYAVASVLALRDESTGRDPADSPAPAKPDWPSPPTSG